jgi:hypothetical protein
VFVASVCQSSRHLSFGVAPLFSCGCVHSFLVRLAGVHAAWPMSHVAWCRVAFSRAFALSAESFSLRPRHPWAGRAGRAADRVAVWPSICVSGHVGRSLSACAHRSLPGAVNFARLALSRVSLTMTASASGHLPCCDRESLSRHELVHSLGSLARLLVLLGLRFLQTPFVALSHFISAAFPSRGRAAF